MLILKYILLAAVIISFIPIYLLYLGFTIAIIILELTTPSVTPPTNMIESEGMTIGFRLLEVLVSKPVSFVKEVYHQII